ncbi:MAG: hypothetical protein K6T92_06450, partial [Candidatus Rokubacteria bacterium]|nr:hypothetical protein [Candidatus Rokubacteria bacterium]
MRRILLCLAALLSALALSACQERGIRQVDGRIEVRLWHSMGGPNGDALQRIVDGFNAAQTTYEVRAIFQGGYPESLKKLVSSFGTASMPTMIQLDDIELQFMVDSEATVPVQDFIDLDAISGDAAHGYPPPVRAPGTLTTAYCGELIVVQGECTDRPP